MQRFKTVIYRSARMVIAVVIVILIGAGSSIFASNYLNDSSTIHLVGIAAGQEVFPSPAAYLPVLLNEMVGTPSLTQNNLTPTPTLTFTPSPTTYLNRPTFTPTNTSTSTPKPCQNLLINSGFENDSGWLISLNEYLARYSTDRYYSGQRSLQVGITSPSENIYSFSSAIQLVKMPENFESAKLTFWLYSISDEPVERSVLSSPFGVLPSLAAQAGDAQYVLILDENGNEIQRLISNRMNDRKWVSFSFYLSKEFVSGQWIKVYFGVFNNGFDGVTSMFVDETILRVCDS